MRLGQRAAVTDTGRKRRHNEDSLIVEPPIFGVADGMGGAQAGEVASGIVASVFREYHAPDDLPPAERLVALIQEANRRIYERARGDAEHSGMGTTTTAALVEDDRIAIAHVGDSRAYRIRGGALEQLTNDHSLVGDLMRSGRLTPEEAKMHPQRSVITRALGTDPEVDVDTLVVDAEPGDIFLLCSDGLPTMVDDDEILQTVVASRSLESAAKALVQAANRGGGDDNVTVVLFAVESGEATLEDTAVGDGGEATGPDLEDTLSDLEPPAAETPDREPAPTTAVFSRDELERALAAHREPEPPDDPEKSGWLPLEEAREPEVAPRSGWGRRVLVTLLAIAVLVILLALAFWGLSTAHFVGAEKDGRVAVYQGLPWDVADGVGLYRARYVSRLQAVQLSRAERVRLFDHELVSYDVARSRVARYEQEGVP